MKLLTTKETCDILRISRTTLWRLVRNGTIKCKKIGKKNLFDQDNLEQIIN